MSEFLKCDAVGCDHFETLETITADLVGKPCPKCGANLLTQGDFDTYMSVVRPAIRAMIDAGLSEPAPVGTPRDEALRVNYHDGQLTITSPLKPNGGKAA